MTLMLEMSPRSRYKPDGPVYAMGQTESVGVDNQPRLHATSPFVSAVLAGPSFRAARPGCRPIRRRPIVPRPCLDRREDQRHLAVRALKRSVGEPDADRDVPAHDPLKLRFDVIRLSAA